MMTSDSSKSMPAIPANVPVLARVRAAALAELRTQSRGLSWQRQAAGVVLTVLATTALTIEVGSLLSIVDLSRLAHRALPVTLLLVLQIAGVFLAIAPGRRLARFGAVLLAAAAAAAVVGWRGTSGGGEVGGAMSPLACSLSHVAVDLIPLTAVLYALRRFAWTLGRAVLAGAAAGATGAIAGELACARGWSHVLVQHVGSALLITLLCVIISRARRPDTFAP
jgi:hypothetical protein